ncbi:hypothetical protein [uncultured Flavobacterium sp.]|uniref:hypothetical protein n=1 Tax=uncultured Flavobacterium sp. TaxID=165435 RepID=UPI0030CA3AFF|tara:strand:- start:44 stop:664 length:621 start_codon:yes stop_codon:yes gene_type:complete
MTKIITFIALLICSYLTAQTSYETEMKNGFLLWQSEKNTEASVVFEKIASEEKDKWLPNYYVALINALSSFQTQDKEELKSLLETAQKALDIEIEKDSKNAELLVVQGLIYTGWIVSDPMTNGMKYSGMANGVYAKASKIAPNNPRVILAKAEFEMGSARYFGQDTTPMCEQIAKSVPLFESFKPETAFHPNWGLDRAKEVAANCK